MQKTTRNNTYCIICIICAHTTWFIYKRSQYCINLFVACILYDLFQNAPNSISSYLLYFPSYLLYFPNASKTSSYLLYSSGCHRPCCIQAVVTAQVVTGRCGIARLHGGLSVVPAMHWRRHGTNFAFGVLGRTGYPNWGRAGSGVSLHRALPSLEPERDIIGLKVESGWPCMASRFPDSSLISGPHQGPKIARAKIYTKLIAQLCRLRSGDRTGSHRI